MIELVSGLHADGLTIVLVTHDPSVAEHSGRIIRIQDGRFSAESKGHQTPT